MKKNKGTFIPTTLKVVRVKVVLLFWFGQFEKKLFLMGLEKKLKNGGRKIYLACGEG